MFLGCFQCLDLVVLVDKDNLKVFGWFYRKRSFGYKCLVKNSTRWIYGNKEFS